MNGFCGQTHGQANALGKDSFAAYQLAKANNLAAREYKAYLTKFPDHPDKRKLEDFIRKNPDPER